MTRSLSAGIRAFIAIAPDSQLVEELEKVQRQLQAKPGADCVRWTRPGHLHLTLKFLGTVSGEGLSDLSAALDRAGAAVASFQLALEGVGCFPNPNNPRVVWVGIGGQLESLRKLQARIEQETQGLGDHTEERGFEPHLTIGRVKAKGKEARKAGGLVQRAAVPKLGDWSVRQIHLMQSELSPEGASYTTLATVALKG